jgi:large subunit ribosomal protein L9
MKIILIKQVPKIGDKGDIAEVSPGYARNFLIPRGFAYEATKQAILEIKSKKTKIKKEKDVILSKRKKLKSLLSGQTILVKSSANEEGHLFGGVSAEDITNSIEKRKKIKIDPKSIKLNRNIKILGDHEVCIDLGDKEEIKIIVKVENKE